MFLNFTFSSFFMDRKKGSAGIYFILGILLLILAFLFYLFYEYVPLDYQTSNVFIPAKEFGTINLSFQVKQFYPNMKFNHNKISYNIEDACSEEKKSRMIEAFRLLTLEVPEISFYPASNKPDIIVMCTQHLEEFTGRNFFIAGEGGAEQIIQTKRFNVITKGIVLLYDHSHNSLECAWPIVELHELTHVFGFQHSEDKESLMYPYIESCSQKLDQEIISDLRTLYAQEHLVDLYFESVEAVKHGRYLDFNATIKNGGDIEARNVFLTIYDSDTEGESFPLENIDFGAGVTFSVSNAKLNSRSSKIVRIIIDANNLISEFDKKNNEVILEFN